MRFPVTSKFILVSYKMINHKIIILPSSISQAIYSCEKNTKDPRIKSFLSVSLSVRQFLSASKRLSPQERRERTPTRPSCLTTRLTLKLVISGNPHTLSARKGRDGEGQRGDMLEKEGSEREGGRREVTEREKERVRGRYR